MRPLVACLLALLCGCAANPRLDALSEGETVTVAVSRSEQARPDARIRNQAVGKDAGGGGTGMLAGGLAGLSCGPFAVICVPGGMLVGAATGAGVGAVVGLAAGLSAEQEARLSSRLSQALQRGDLQEALRTQVAERLRRSGFPPADVGTVTVDLKWGDLHFVLGHGEQLGLVATVPVTVQRQGGKAPQARSVTFSGPMIGLATWLDERSDFMEASLNTAVQQIAAQIGAELAAR